MSELPTRWRTKDGRDLAIADMGEQHLRNTIAMLERNMMSRDGQALLLASQPCPFNGEHAQDAYHDEVDRICDTAATINARARRTVDAMRAELDRREGRNG